MADDDRCGYHSEIGVAGADLSTEPCDRPAWRDHDRCVWHARVDGKHATDLEAAAQAGATAVSGAYLREASLADVDWLAGASLVGAEMTDADLTGTDLSGADLTLATLQGASAINADFGGANLEGAVLSDADLRRARLVDARLHEAVLTNVHVGGGTEIGDVTFYDRENAPPDLSENEPLEAAAWSYRQLQQLYTDNALPTLARRSYYLERDALRRQAWSSGAYAEALKWEVSRWVMRYGSSPYRVLLTSLVVILAATLLYPFTGGIQEIRNEQTITYTLENPQDAPRWWLWRVLFKSLYFSVVTFATLGYGDIQPIGVAARLLAGVESILGALLAALLVFVLARIVTW